MSIQTIQVASGGCRGVREGFRGLCRRKQWGQTEDCCAKWWIIRECAGSQVEGAVAAENFPRGKEAGPPGSRRLHVLQKEGGEEEGGHDVHLSATLLETLLT